MAEIKRLRLVAGNKVTLIIPMQKVVFTQAGKATENYYPPTGTEIGVTLQGQYRKYEFVPTVTENNIIFTDNGTLAVGEYAVVITVKEPDDTRRRSKWLMVVTVYDSNEPVMDEFDDFPDYAEGAIIEGSVFYFAKGDPGEGVPEGGATGQVLRKKSNEDYDTEWADESVTSVNGKTGAVTLSADDVGALPDTTPIPSQTSDLINNSGFITKTVDDLVNYYLRHDTYTKDEVQQLVSTIKQFSYEVVPTLPEASAETMHCIYLAPSADPQAQNIKDEYITLQSDSQRDVYFWEQIGSTAIDLSDYYTSAETDRAISSALTAALADYTTTEALTRLLAGKQDVIRDLDTIRSGAQAGATAYQMPAGGIPVSDLSTEARQVISDASSAATAASNAAQAANQAAQQAAQDVATLIANTDAVLGADTIPQFSTSATYAAGDFVMYQDKLYKFLVSHSPGAWNANEVQQTDLVSEVNDMVKSDYEEVIIDLKTENNVPLPNVFVAVQVEGEQSARNLTTDSAGRCSTSVQKGLEYTVSCNDVPDYYPVNPITKRASIPVRYIEVTYIEDTSLTVEHVQINLSYSDENLGKATWVRVTYGGENYTLPVNNDVAEVDIRLGTVYTISFEDVLGYRTPQSRTYTAEHHGTRPVNVRYQAAIAGIRWLMTDNAEKEINDVSNDDYIEGRIFGLIVQTSDLMAEGCSFVIPVDILFGSITTSQWLSANVNVTTLQFFSSQAMAVADLDGEDNCAKIKQWIAQQADLGNTYTSRMIEHCEGRVGGAPGFDTTKDYAVGDYVIYHDKLQRFITAHPAGAWVEGETVEMTGYIMPDGVVRVCFSPAYGQLYAWRLNRDEVNAFTQSVFGLNVINYVAPTSQWWSSTQYNAANAVCLGNGSFNLSYKVYSLFNVLPVLAY